MPEMQAKERDMQKLLYVIIGFWKAKTKSYLKLLIINTKSLNDFECRCHFCNNVLKLNQKSERKNSVKPTRVTGLMFLYILTSLF